MTAVEITTITKLGGPLSKHITLGADGNYKSDGSACVMSKGVAQRMQITDVEHLAEVIGRLRAEQAITLGSLRTDLADAVVVVTKNKLNGAKDAIARTKNDILYQEGRPAFTLFDHDTKAMPADVDERMRELGGFYDALVSIIPDLAHAAHVVRRSTSAGLYRTDTGEKLCGSNGEHGYVHTSNGADSERFLKVLHDRCWLAGLGWMMVGAGGQLLERSIIDRMVGAPERLVFEGAPVLDHPLAQDIESRRPVATPGDMLDTLAACPPLTLVEMARVRELKAKEITRLKPDCARTRTAFIRDRAQVLAASKGISIAAATQTIERQCDGILLPDLELPFDQDEFAGCTVADVLADPDRFEGATLADPLEGVGYGRGCAKVMRRADGTPWINSFAHGRTVYRLTYDAKAVRNAITSVPPAEAVNTFVKIAVLASLSSADIEELRNDTAAISGVTRRAVGATLKAAQADHNKRQGQEDREDQDAERHDPRPLLGAPEVDAPWLPVVEVLNETHRTRVTHPPGRDIDTGRATGREVALPDTHAFISANEPESTA